MPVEEGLAHHDYQTEEDGEDAGSEQDVRPGMKGFTVEHDGLTAAVREAFQ